MPRRRNRLPGKDETIGGEFDLRVVRSGQAASDALLEHHLGMLHVAPRKGALDPNPLRMKGLQYFLDHVVDVEDAPERIGVIGH